MQSIKTSAIASVHPFYITEDEQHLHHVLVLHDGHKAVVEGAVREETEFVECLYDETESVADIIMEHRRDW